MWNGELHNTNILHSLSVGKNRRDQILADAARSAEQQSISEWDVEQATDYAKGVHTVSQRNTNLQLVMPP